MLGLGLSFTRVAVSARKALLAILHITGSKGLVFDKAGGVLVNGRTSTATFKDFEGIVRTAKAGEMRLNKGRRVENRYTNSEGIYPAVTVKNALAVGNQWTFTPTNSNAWLNFDDISINIKNYLDLPNLIGKTYTVSFLLTGVVGEIFTLRIDMAGYAIEVLCIVNNKRISVNISPTVNSPAWGVNLHIKRKISDTITTVNISELQIEEVTNQSNQVASEYIPTGTGIIQNSGLEGIAYFDYTNNNSVDVNNILTESKGINITPKPEMLSEGLRTNLLPYSEDFNNAVWTKTQSTVGLSNNRNGITTQQLIDTTANNHHRFSRGLNIIAGVDYTLSTYLKKINNRYAVLWLYGLTTGTTLARCFFDLQTGTIANLQFGTASIEDIGNGLFRCSVTANSGTNAQVLNIIQSTQNSIALIYAGTAIPVLEVGGAQLEQSRDLTSYIPTTTAAVTRSADYINLPLVSGINFNPNEGVLLFKYKPDYNLSAYSGYLFEVSTAFGALLYDHPSAGLIATYDGVNVSSKNIGTANKNNTYLFSIIWSQSLNSLSINVSTDSGLTWATWPSTVFSGAFQTGNSIGIFTGLNRTALLDAVVLYDALPKPTIVETQTWVENNAGGLTS